jgi:hypothetical protein
MCVGLAARLEHIDVELGAGLEQSADVVMRFLLWLPLTLGKEPPVAIGYLGSYILFIVEHTEKK